MSSKTSESAGGAPAAAAGARHAAPHVRIRSEDSGVQLNLGELWEFRELLYFLTLRDIKVRYKQTLMGAAWVLVQPLATMLIFTLVFTRFARLDAGPVPYPLFAYSGLLVWNFFSGAVTSGTNSLTSNTHLVTKVYFPKMFVPAAAAGAGLVDFGVGSILLALLAAYYRVEVTWQLLLLPFFVVLATALALGAGMLVSALTVKYRDLRHALPFALQFWMFASPVLYPSDIVPASWRWILVVNPMAGVLEGFRSSLTGRPLDWAPIAFSAAFSAALLSLAFYVFRRLEDTFADVL